MATVPGQLIWEIVKKNNSFLVKEFGNGTAGVRFSKESNNLYNLNSYKHSGLANKKTVTIQPVGKDQAVLLATTKTKKQNKPAALLHKSVMKKEFRRMANAVANQVGDNYYRPDLKKAALSRLSVVHRSLKVAKSGVKKRNRQAVKVRGRKTILNNVLEVGDDYNRPDLKKAALARLSLVHRRLKVAKSGVKKRNRRAAKVRGWK
ncbi:hypothetical protein TIFTF001_006494 [Ficus carica]|uniref:Ribosomal eL28/Mak16 domain-containing protein n=1 Tax=Ficus carica TaxID=3494 RepID=A0AA88CZT3_FICCA|nr:hypothetical protein TIFTF001_006494 [Ficus carica]